MAREGEGGGGCAHTPWPTGVATLFVCVARSRVKRFLTRVIKQMTRVAAKGGGGCTGEGEERGEALSRQMLL